MECKDIGIRKSEFVAKTQLLSAVLTTKKNEKKGVDFDISPKILQSTYLHRSSVKVKITNLFSLLIWFFVLRQYYSINYCTKLNNFFRTPLIDLIPCMISFFMNAFPYTVNRLNSMHDFIFLSMHFDFFCKKCMN